MISPLEIAERTRSGPKMNEKDWNLGVFKKMQELCKKHNLAYSKPERFSQFDDDYVDNAFQAAVDFLAGTGVYCVSSNKVIAFSEQEVKDAAKEAPSEIIVGHGRDARTIRKREIEDDRPVNVIAGGHCPWSEELFPLPLMVRALARIPRVDMVEGFNFISLDGLSIEGMPMAAYAAKRAIEKMRDGVRRAGRAGMAITYYPIHTDASTLAAPIDPDYGLRRTDGILLSVLPDIKVEENLLTASIVHGEYGSYKVNGGAFGIPGGFSGGIEGAIVETIAKTLAAWIIYRDSLQYDGQLEQLIQSESVQDTVDMPSMLPPSYAITQALRRNTNIITFGENRFWNVLRSSTDDFSSEENLLCEALSAIVGTVIGKNLVYTITHPPVIEWNIEVSDATVKAKIKLEDAEQIVRSIVRSRLKDKLQRRTHLQIDRRLLVYSDPRRFIEPIQKCYDFVREKTSLEFLSQKSRVQAYLEDLGLDFSA